MLNRIKENVGIVVEFAKEEPVEFLKDIATWIVIDTVCCVGRCWNNDSCRWSYHGRCWMAFWRMRTDVGIDM